MFDCLEHLDYNKRSEVFAQSSNLVYALQQIPSITQLHHKVNVAIVEESLVEPDDVGVVHLHQNL